MMRYNVSDIKALKGRRKITMLTAYDYPMASAVEKAGIDVILVGDSLANVVLGLDSTKEVTMDQMVYHAKAVRRGAKNTFIVGDMPFEAYQKDVNDAAKNARRFISEAGCDAVKLEWFGQALEAVSAVVRDGISVMGHIGLTPQTADELGGFKVQGKDAGAAKRLIEQARQFEEAGCFCILLECVPDRVAEMITKRAKVPTIGIGAGPYCDGQVLVTHDMLGLFDRYTPKFVKKYASLSDDMTKAFEEYKKDVAMGRFPDEAHSFGIKPDELKKLEKEVEKD
ncbi:MAG TPA: 3-methyl-2-oxobutanoate hydroxymethyltransferase [Candidatus Omnitrophica bacterium]|nr:3-methyl-2-oxobutanoate hydroxymethyltransferase [Candidatus Omnitrophota bacterium]